jgi:hypothetical protein
MGGARGRSSNYIIDGDMERKEYSKLEGKSFTDQHIQQWVTEYYDNKDTLVTEDERKNLFDLPLTERLQTKSNLLLLWLQTVQLISNRQLPYSLRQTTGRLTLYKFFNRVRPTELEETSLHDRENDDDFTPTETA